MAVPAGLKTLTPAMFRRPDAMDAAFVSWFDRVCTLAKLTPHITGDARDPGTVPPGGSATSLHYRGRAVDLRSRTWTREQKWRLLVAVVAMADWAPGRIELELVHSPTDRHWHIGVDPEAPNREHRLIEADE